MKLVVTKGPEKYWKRKRGEIEPQAGPSGTSQQGLKEEEEIVEEQLDERVELESMVVEEPEMERLDVPSEVVEAEEEVHEEDGTIPDREIQELRLEEDPSRAPRRRNFSPITFDIPSEPEIGGGPIRDSRSAWQSSRGNPANRCFRIRTTPYERSRDIESAQGRIIERQRTPEDMRAERRQHWQVKLAELVSYMQGYTAAQGRALTPEELKRECREGTELGSELDKIPD
ncbi:hypothetical protein Anas_14679 [Armadillidium nasatum]|uniref:Uncharacterized protein n=1 Tax=Armadillidium nasatum TaxID=96803 RepID=A0A5N5T3X3_9CRUS|nr:hypothetical protein Anas_14679 [Armadillidium nasatum]